MPRAEPPLGQSPQPPDGRGGASYEDRAGYSARGPGVWTGRERIAPILHRFEGHLPVPFRFEMS